MGETRDLRQFRSRDKCLPWRNFPKSMDAFIRESEATTQNSPATAMLASRSRGTGARFGHQGGVRGAADPLTWPSRRSSSMVSASTMASGRVPSSNLSRRGMLWRGSESKRLMRVRRSSSISSSMMSVKRRLSCRIGS